MACSAGAYCQQPSTEETLWPAGFHCPPFLVRPYDCSDGFYCLAGSGSQTPCPPGYSCMMVDVQSLTPCPPG